MRPVEEFDRVRRVERRVASDPHLSHSSTAEQSLETVATGDDGADVEGLAHVSRGLHRILDVAGLLGLGPNPRHFRIRGVLSKTRKDTKQCRGIIVRRCSSF